MIEKNAKNVNSGNNNFFSSSGNASQAIRTMAYLIERRQLRKDKYGKNHLHQLHVHSSLVSQKKNKFTLLLIVNFHLIGQ